MAYVLLVLISLYLICATLLALYAISQTVLLVVYLVNGRKTPAPPPLTVYPHVAVQLPMYNERTVVARLLDACAQLDYPRECLTIQVLDDSTDETHAIAAERTAYWRAQGVNVQHIRRDDRSGYKAGALAYGMTLCDAEYFAVLDADFVPPPDFLRKTIPHLVENPRLGMVQTRWGHLNAFDNPLTWGQMLSVDAHFVVEQTARNRAGMLMNFNGSGGVWRAQTIREAGGWDGTTLSEDLDLSYRAQFAGWRFLYLPDVVVPGELPPQISAYKLQQARWAKGNTQCLTRLLRQVWQDPALSLMQRVMATIHLCQYLPHPLMVMLLLLTPPLILLKGFHDLPMGPLGAAGLGPILIYVCSQQALYNDWPRRLLILPMLIALGTGIAWSNTRAVLGGLFGTTGEFKRTPKRGDASAGKVKGYTLLFDNAALVELALAAYAFWGVWLAATQYQALIAYMSMYAVAFASVAVLTMRDSMAEA